MPDDGDSAPRRATRTVTPSVPSSGAVHYWRLAPERWESCIATVAAMGLSMVETYVPWSVHERDDGTFDFGQHEPRHDVGRFLDLVQEAGLRAFVRPGPHINAELTLFGIPRRVIDDTACQAQSPRGNPVVLYFPPQMFPVPSYASDAFQAEASAWFDAVGPVLAPRLAPAGGPVDYLQVDNEAGLYFRNGPYGQDYHPDSIRDWQSFLVDQYGDEASARRSHGRQDLQPPTRFATDEPLARHLDWARYQEEMVTRALRRMRTSMERAGLGGVPVLHNISLGDAGLPMDLPALEDDTHGAPAADIVGLDYYYSASAYDIVRRRTSYLVGTSRYAYAPELGAGAPPWFPPLGDVDSRFTAWVASAYGLRALNVYMAVDRDRWFGAPIDDEGTPRETCAAWSQLLRALDDWDFSTMKRSTRVAIVWPRTYLRLTRATHLMGPMSPSTTDALSGAPVHACRRDPLGLGDEVQIDWWRVAEALRSALDEARVPYSIVDAGSSRTRRSLEAYDIIFCPTFRLFDSGLADALGAAARAGCHVVCGPRAPRLAANATTASDAAADFRGLAQCELRPTLTGDDEALREAARLLVDDWIARHGLQAEPLVGPDLLCTVHEHDDGRRLFFVLNPTDTPRTFRAPGAGLYDALTAEPLQPAHQDEADGAAPLHIEPWSGRLLGVRP